MPSEHSREERRRQGRIPKTGNSPARRVLVEGAWAARSPAKVSRPLPLRLAKVPQAIQAISWKAQGRLCKRSHRSMARGQPVNPVGVAIARARAAFVWTIARAGQVAHYDPPQPGEGVGGNDCLPSSEQQKRRRPGLGQPSLRVLRLE